MTAGSIADLQFFRQELFHHFHRLKDATMQTLDALCTNLSATSPVALSENPHFERHYAMLTDVVTHYNPKEAEAIIHQRHQAEVEKQRYALFALDTTSLPRLHAETLEDRGFVHAANPAPGNIPVTLGHQYSALCALPLKESGIHVPWVLPLSARRVSTADSIVTVGIEQLEVSIQGIPLAVCVADCEYQIGEMLHQTYTHKNLVMVTRCRSNRVFYRAVDPSENLVPKRGHPRWYGAPLRLNQLDTHGISDVTETHPFQTRKGKTYTAKLTVWFNLCTRQKNKLPLNRYPFTLIRIELFDEHLKAAGQPPMWLTISGEQRNALSALELWQAYAQRFDIEHFFKFAKNHLLLDKFQTPDVHHEERWVSITCAAHAQLYFARFAAQNAPTHWQQYLPEFKNSGPVFSPRQVQKYFGRIIAIIGTPASPPKPRGISPGRLKGQKQPRRTRHPVVVKGKIAQKDPEKVAA